MTKEIRREDVGEKWCFACRKRLPHAAVTLAPIEMSYYGPHWFYECSGCKGDHVDFPGTFSGREWADE